MKIKIGISNRHIHLTKQDKDYLFGKDYKLIKKNDLVQTGEFACEETVSIKTSNGIIEHVRIVGPVREYTQVEVLEKDKEVLGINPPMRNSGDLNNSESITIIGPINELKKNNCCIIANKHIHINSNNTYNLTNGQIVNVMYKDKLLENVYIKERNDFVLEFHINKDEAIELGMETGEYIELDLGD